MKTLLLLATTLGIAGCMSAGGMAGREPNYVASQVYQSPAQGYDVFGAGELPPRVGAPQ